jgi:hypothetical protein
MFFIAAKLRHRPVKAQNICRVAMGCVLLSGWIELIVYTIDPNRTLKELPSLRTRAVRDIKGFDAATL